MIFTAVEILILSMVFSAVVGILGILWTEWGMVRAQKACTKMDTTIAEYYRGKYRQQAMVSSHYQAAKNLRKQGVPLEMAMMILFGHERLTARSA